VSESLVGSDVKGVSLLRIVESGAAVVVFASCYEGEFLGDWARRRLGLVTTVSIRDYYGVNLGIPRGREVEHVAGESAPGLVAREAVCFIDSDGEVVVVRRLVWVGDCKVVADCAGCKGVDGLHVEVVEKLGADVLVCEGDFEVNEATLESVRTSERVVVRGQQVEVLVDACRSRREISRRASRRSHEGRERVDAILAEVQLVGQRVQRVCVACHCPGPLLARYWQGYVVAPSSEGTSRVFY